MKRGLAALAAALFGLPGLALAGEPPSGVYLGLRAGATFAEEAEVDVGAISGDITFDNPGWAVDGAFGYAHPSGLRGDLALGIGRSDFDEFRLAGVGVDFDGDARLVTGMASLYYDLYPSRLGLAGDIADRLAIFAGGGAGFVYVDLDGTAATGAVLQDDTAGLGYHGSAGISYAVTKQTVVDLQYVYFWSPDLSFDGGTEGEFTSHNLLAGLRFFL